MELPADTAKRQKRRASNRSSSVEHEFTNICSKPVEKLFRFSRHVFRHAMLAQSAGTVWPTKALLLRSAMGVRLAKEAVMRALMWPTAAALLIAVGHFSVPAANAQVQSHSPSDQYIFLDQKLDAAPGLTDKSPNISDQKLDAVASAIERVASLKQDYRRRIAAAAPSDKEHIALEAEKEQQ